MITINKENKKQIEKCDYMVIRRGELILGYKVKNKVTGSIKCDEINLGQIEKYSKLKDATLNIQNTSWKNFLKVDDNIVFSISDDTNKLLEDVGFVSIGVELNILRGKKTLSVNIARISCPKNKLNDYLNI